MNGTLKLKIGGLVITALTGAYLYMGVDLAPHQEYAEEPAVATD